MYYSLVKQPIYNCECGIKYNPVEFDKEHCPVCEDRKSKKYKRQSPFYKVDKTSGEAQRETWARQQREWRTKHKQKRIGFFTTRLVGTN